MSAKSYQRAELEALAVGESIWFSISPTQAYRLQSRMHRQTSLRFKVSNDFGEMRFTRIATGQRAIPCASQRNVSAVIRTDGPLIELALPSASLFMTNASAKRLIAILQEFTR